MQEALNPIIYDYIIKYHQKSSRYEIDLKLLREGYTPDEIEAVWKYVEAGNQKAPFSLNKFIIGSSRLLSIIGGVIEVILALEMLYNLIREIVRYGGLISIESGIQLIFIFWLGIGLTLIIAALKIKNNLKLYRKTIVVTGIISFVFSVQNPFLIATSLVLIAAGLVTLFASD